MAIQTPSRIATLIQDSPDAERLVEALHPWRRRLSLQQTFRWTIRGIITGLLLACFLLILSRLFPWATALYWASGSAVACIVIALVAAIWYRPSFGRTARVIDK